MNKDEMIKALRNGVCEINFAKVNGDQRVMLCTLNESVLPNKEVKAADNMRVVSNTSIAVWDIQAEGWRSFRIDSVNTFKVI